MEIGSVSASVTSALTSGMQEAQARQRALREEQAQQTQQTQQSAPTQQTAAAAPERRVEPTTQPDASAQTRPQPEANRPTVNVEGQVVGRRINTTA
jgi:sRNA-binding protein